MTIKELIATHRGRELRAFTGLQALVDQAKGEGRDFTLSERSSALGFEGELKVIREQIESLEAEQAADEAAERLQSEIRQTAPRPAYDRVFRVGDEPRTYSARSENPDAPSFLLDMYRLQVMNDPEAGARLERHGREMRAEAVPGGRLERAFGTSGIAGFVPPAFMIDLWAELARDGRPLANALRTAPLPASGMTVEVPQVTTGSSVDVQTAQNANLSNADMVAPSLEVNVNTIGGYLRLSRQSLERSEGFDAIAMRDLYAAYSAAVELQVVNGTGSSGQHLGLLNVSGINSVVYTDADPTVAELWPKLADAVQQVITARRAGPSVIAMHPRRWAWFQSALSTSHPLIGQSGAQTGTGGTSNGPAYGAGQGKLFGCDVLVSTAIPTTLSTTRDAILVVNVQDPILLEDNGGSPVQLSFSNVQTLTCDVGVYGYSAFASARQPKGISAITGSGLTTPTF